MLEIMRESNYYFQVLYDKCIGKDVMWMLTNSSMRSNQREEIASTWSRNDLSRVA